jgi:phosphoribosylamine--glycine ligase
VKKGDAITGLDADFGDAKVFHAGTTDANGAVVTSGGRVLCVVARGERIGDAQRHAYEAVSKIRWRGEQHRSDIGWRAVAREKN